jgi:hypothetical protein
LRGSKLNLNRSFFKGDTSNDSITAGVLLKFADANIENCNFTHHKGGAIMMNLEEDNKVNIHENEIYSCETSGIYCQGDYACPVIEK